VTLFSVIFLDGPCAHDTRKIEMGAQVDPTVACGGAIYVYRGSEPPAPGVPFTGPLFYAESGGPYDNSIERIKGERDVYRAWGNLRTALRSTSSKELRRVETARRRIRRAVR